jgi:hypothetical protein
MSKKASYLLEMHASFAELTSVVDAIPPERLTQIGVTEEWSARDMLAHMAGYERWVATAIFGDLTGKKLSTHDFYGRDDAPSEADEANDDTVNAWVVAHARRLRVEDVLTEFRWAHRLLVEAVEACDEATFDDPNRLPFTKGRTLADILPGQCWGHHREHLPQLRRLVAQPGELRREA